MKIDEAYSIELKKILDAEEAYEIYWDGEGITDQRNFICADPMCNISITCANLYKKRSEMKKAPYFLSVGDHINGCKWANRGKMLVNEYDKRNVPAPYINPQKSYFHFNRPANHWKKVVNNNANNFIKLNDAESRYHSDIKKTINTKERIPHRYEIGSLVNKYEIFEEEGTTDTNYIILPDVKNVSLPYSEMFVKINKQSLDELSKYKRVYYGNATVIRFSEYYLVKFADHFIVDGNPISPSMFINNKVIENYYRGSSYWQERLNLILNKELKCYIFTDRPVKSKSNYINFAIQNLDYLSFKEID